MILHAPSSGLRNLSIVALCILMSAALLACSVDEEDSVADDRMVALEGKAQSLEESLETLAEENVELRDEIVALQERLNDLEDQVQELEEYDAKADWDAADKDQWFDSDSKDDGLSVSGDTALEATARMVEEAGGVVHYVNHAGRGDRTVLVTPTEFEDGETPLIVSLHGFGGNSAYQSAYVPLHERVNSDGFALLLPNGIRDAQGNRFWNPTDQCCDGGKSGEDDVAYLTELIAEARKVKDFGAIYLFGYSNGGFMSHHMACKSMSGLRAVASLAGTSYVDDSGCDGAPAVSVLQIHGTADDVILFDGAETEPDPKSDGEPAFYAGAQEMVMRWGRQAGCEWPENPEPYATLDLDQYVLGAETEMFRLKAGCAEGISIELWVGVESSHSPGYGDAFVDALLGWLLAQD